MPFPALNHAIKTRYVVHTPWVQEFSHQTLGYPLHYEILYVFAMCMIDKQESE